MLHMHMRSWCRQDGCVCVCAEPLTRAAMAAAVQSKGRQSRCRHRDCRRGGWGSAAVIRVPWRQQQQQQQK